MPAGRYRLCGLDEIADGGSAGFAVGATDATSVGIMAIRRGRDVRLYENRCPHIGTPLDFEPGQFLDLEREHILCSTHGALFRIDDGYCVSGPCAGQDLTSIKAVVEDGMIYAVFD